MLSTFIHRFGHTILQNFTSEIQWFQLKFRMREKDFHEQILQRVKVGRIDQWKAAWFKLTSMSAVSYMAPLLTIHLFACAHTAPVHYFHKYGENTADAGADSLLVSATYSTTVLAATRVQFPSRSPLPIPLPSLLPTLSCHLSTILSH